MTEQKHLAYNKICIILGHGLIALYGLACLWLYYHQSVADLSVPDPIPYQSDLPLHISMVVEDGWYYSFTAILYQLLYILCGGSTVGIALLLTTASVGTVYLTAGLMKQLAVKEHTEAQTLILALALNLVMPIYLRFVGEFRYASYQSGNIWHNSTYICMRVVALAVLIKYFQLEEKYREGLTAGEWITFALLNIICTGIKPSFLVVFSPIVGLFLLTDLIKKVPLSKILVFGSALLPSGLVIIWQNMVLFGEDTGNGITIRPWYTFSLHAIMTKPAVLCSVLFCAAVLVITWRQLLTDKKYRFLSLMAALGFLEALCIVESGSRAVDGNFLWGYSIALFTWFVVCAVKWLEIFYPGKTIQTSVQIALGVLFCWHLYCGIYFFAELVSGASYWMK